MARAPAGDDGAADREPDLGWLLRLSVVVVLFAAVGLWRSEVMDIPFRDPRGEWLKNRIVFTAGIVASLMVLDGGWRSWRATGSLRGTFGAVRRRWPTHRVAMLLAGLTAYHAIYFTYHNLKSWVVFRTPQDAMLVEWERILFFGHDPAVLVHNALGEYWATWILIAIYESFPSFVSFCFPAALVFADRIRHGFVYIASAVWVWIFGVACYYLIPSLGPFDEQPENFAGLPHSMITDTQEKYLAQRAHLLADPQAGDAAAQIAAFASLHVGVTCVIWLMLRYYGYRRIAIAWGLYLIGTIIATVHLGWHYFVDDIAGVAMAVAAVWLGHRTIYPKGYVAAPRPPQPQAEAHASGAAPTGSTD